MLEKQGKKSVFVVFVPCVGNQRV